MSNTAPSHKSKRFTTIKLAINLDKINNKIYKKEFSTIYIKYKYNKKYEQGRLNTKFLAL
jgi:hypothetical protein